MAATEMSKKIGMMGKYAQKEMGEGRSTYPGPSEAHLEEGLDTQLRALGGEEVLNVLQQGRPVDLRIDNIA